MLCAQFRGSDDVMALIQITGAVLRLLRALLTQLPSASFSNMTRLRWFFEKSFLSAEESVTLSNL